MLERTEKKCSRAESNRRPHDDPVPVGLTSHALYLLSYESGDWCSSGREKIL